MPSYEITSNKPTCRYRSACPNFGLLPGSRQTVQRGACSGAMGV